ncbi:ABC transporter ATP-binding protein [Pelagovum pacificum]|uniref:ATP-binding cassette domain-containing protein n=2 Tax=Pelagovum pacificum TaxID=2588711 RepID=A0A5C5GA55_9RHOB|nr:oligopeptide/dipeptide ABC transporter ATP-binding protein [Pelagovum pacificum]QQA45037.1 ATP-binding cassette domain-containing protein [Pelagovum pacificum]TNY31551.1 ATP-binding cassette domain-containing protein [Pelagovum pacificum]
MDSPSSRALPNAEPLLRIENLGKKFYVKPGAFGTEVRTVHALEDVTIDVRRGETLSVVGESGCGKSTLGFSILQLLKPSEGSVTFEGTDLTQLSEKQMRRFRQKLQVVFQDPYATLNPRMTIGEVLAEPLLLHGLATKKTVRDKSVEMLGDVGLPTRVLSSYPHQLSGGQRQRVAIARALACDPEFIVCDEAVSALDVSVQAQIVNLLMSLQKKYGLTYLFIAHDLAVVRHMSDRVLVMYLGRPAELAPKKALFHEPLHPYTRALLSAVPEPDPERERNRRRQELVGEIPSPLNPPTGCRFHTRCPLAETVCSQKVPQWREAAPEHWVACHMVPETIQGEPS